jgi:ankyrin repeat protein/beta-lactamase regulating signal transducer with metallopeptidase domain
MNAILQLFSEPWSIRLGWVLVHFLWEGAVIGFLLAAILRSSVVASSHARYVVIASALMLCSLAPVATWIVLSPHSKFSAPAPSPEASHDKIIGSVPPTLVPRSPLPSGVQAAPLPASRTIPADALIDAASPYLVAVWLAGIVMLSLRLSVGWILVFRISRSGDVIPDRKVLARFHTLVERMEIAPRVRLLRSAMVEVPTLIGWLRPVILLPASVITGLDRSHLEAILAHELAHVRRWDYLVNLIQTILETVLFYHPAVWWISQRLREERENCCDDLALEVTRDRLIYVTALAQLEERRALALTLTASGSLLHRIQRLVGASEQKASTWPFLLLTIALISLGYAAISHASPPANPIPSAVKELVASAPTKSPNTRPTAARLSLQRALNAASTQGDLVEIERLIALGADPNWNKAPVDRSSYFNRSALFVAADANQIEAVKLLLKDGADPNTKDGWSGRSAIEWALSRGNLGAAKILYAAGAKISPARWAAATGDRAAMQSLLVPGKLDPDKVEGAYECAASMGNYEMVKLIENITRKPIPGSFLTSAACSANIPMMQYILSRGADIQKDGGLAIDWALEIYDQPKSVKFLLSRGVDPNRVSHWGGRLLSSAQSAEVTKILLEAGADPKIIDDRGSPLASARDAESVRLMLAHGADIKQRFKGEAGTLVDRAVTSRNVSQDNGDALDELIKQGAELDPKTNGARALETAAFYNKIETARVLLDHGVSPNAQHRYDVNDIRSALSSAGGHGSPELLQLLIDRGADPSGLPDDTISPLESAALRGQMENVEVLLKAGAAGLGRLSMAASAGDLSKIRELLRQGENVNEINKVGYTPLTYAVRRGQVEAARLLLENGANQNIFDRYGVSPRRYFEMGIAEREWDVPDEESQRLRTAFEDLFDKYPADPNYRDSHGRTQLHQVALAASWVLRFNKDEHPDANIRDNEGMPPLLLLAISDQATKTAEVLTIYKNSEKNEVESRWNMSAAIADSLLKLGADPDLPMPNNQTVRTLAIAAAEKAHNSQLVSILKDAKKSLPPRR